MLRSRHTVPLLVIAVVIGGLTAAVALLIDWIPPQATEQAVRTDELTWFVIVASIVIFTIVCTFLIYAVWRFRAKPGDESDGPPIHGNTTLEVVWTIVPALLLAVVAVWAYLVLSDNEALANDREVIDVTAEQFAWTFTYPDGQVESGDLRVPVGRQVELRMRTKDVIHSFYVPEFRVKQDIVPGITTRVVFDATKPGTYQVMCAELCGVGHGVMRARVIAMPEPEYRAWLDEAARTVAAQPAPEPQAGNAPAPEAPQAGNAPAEGPAP